MLYFDSVREEEDANCWKSGSLFPEVVMTLSLDEVRATFSLELVDEGDDASDEVATFSLEEERDLSLDDEEEEPRLTFSFEEEEFSESFSLDDLKESFSFDDVKDLLLIGSRDEGLSAPLVVFLLFFSFLSFLALEGAREELGSAV